ncbi:ParB/RepB/Spo0J family partition protein [Streptomycetaceae bacterium NBC_01309]
MQEARQARQFGYEVSPREAVHTPGAAAYLNGVRQRTRRARRRGLTALFIGFLWLGAFLLGLWLWDLGDAGPAVVIGWIAPLVVLGWPAGRLEDVAGQWTRSRAAQEAALEKHPWQAWPCRLEDADDKWPSRHQALRPYAFGRPVRRLLLLGPDGQPVRSYLTVFPDEVWRSTTDGLGALWVCGDLRFGVVFATPGAALCWPGIPEPAVPAAHRAPVHSPDVVSGLAQEAGAAALHDWLG